MVTVSNKPCNLVRPPVVCLDDMETQPMMLDFLEGTPAPLDLEGKGFGAALYSKTDVDTETQQLAHDFGNMRLDSKKFDDSEKEDNKPEVTSRKVTHLEDLEAASIGQQEESAQMISKEAPTNGREVLLEVQQQAEHSEEMVPAIGDHGPATDAAEETVKAGPPAHPLPQPGVDWKELVQKALAEAAPIAAATNEQSIPATAGHEAGLEETMDDESGQRTSPKNNAAEETAPAKGPIPERTLAPSARTRNSLKQAKQAKDEAAAAAATEASPKESAPALACSTSLPAKPNDWGKHQPVTADQQQPPKPRGRKRKASKVKEEEPQEPKGRAKSRAKSKPKSKPSNTAKHDASATTKTKAKQSKAKDKNQTYVPLEVEGDVNLDRGAAFDAYAAACTAANVHALEQYPEHLSASNPEDLSANKNKKRKTKASQKDQHANKRARCDDGETHVASGKGSPDGTLKAKESRRRKTPAVPEAVARDVAASAVNNAPAPAAACDAPVPEPPAKKKPLTAEAKAKYSRKSCAYKRALNNELKAGKGQAEAKAVARQAYADCE